MSVRSLFTFGMLMAALGCGGDDRPEPGPGPGPGPRQPTELPCRAASCGDASFRHAIPSRGLIRIDLGSGSTSMPIVAGEVAGSRQPLLEFSPYLQATLDHIDDINEMVDAVFEDLEYAAGGEPDEQTDVEHLWRDVDEDSGVDVVLDLESADGVQFALAYYEGPTGFEPLPEDAIVSGTITLGADETIDAFDLEIDLDALSAADPTVDATGAVILAAHSLGETLEVLYDFDNVSIGGEPAESSETTYWVFGEESYGLEFVGIDETAATASVYVRWDEEGGRWDSHDAYDDADLGAVDEFATNCWGADGIAVFDGIAVIDGEGNFYGELEGLEEDCDFSPLADHPAPGPEFDGLPQEGTWDEIDFLASEECDPTVEECLCDPEMDPECV